MSVADVLISRFPLSRAILAYGSSLYTPGAMLDLMIITDDPTHWHTINHHLNPRDYSLVSRSAPSLTPRIQSLGAGFWFNTGIKINDSLIKYGVVDSRYLLDDLLTWRYFYGAGRLQKTFDLLYPTILDKELHTAISLNRRNALKLVMQMLSQGSIVEIKERVLMETLLGLSYLGDIRRGIAEDPGKVKKILEGTQEELLCIYRPIYETLSIKRINESVIFKTPPLDEDILTKLRNRQRRYSTVEALKTLWSVPPHTSLSYLLRKISKRINKT